MRFKGPQKRAGPALLRAASPPILRTVPKVSDLQHCARADTLGGSQRPARGGRRPSEEGLVVAICGAYTPLTVGAGLLTPAVSLGAVWAPCVGVWVPLTAVPS